MKLNFKKISVPLLFLASMSLASAEDPPFLQWNILMKTPRLQSGGVVSLKNIYRPNRVLGATAQAAIDVMHAGINLVWEDKPFTPHTEVRFELENPGKMTPAPGPIIYRSKVAIKVAWGGKTGGYLQCMDTRFGIDMNFSQQPKYEWYVLNLAPLADGINSSQKVALFNTTKMAFLVYQSRRIGFELGWWKYYPPLPQAANLGSNPAYAGYKSNLPIIQAYIDQLMKVNSSEARFVRSLFGIDRK